MTLLEELLKERNLSVYKFSKISGVAYTTALEYVRGKKSLKNCSIEKFNKFAIVLNLNVDTLWKMAEHYDFDAKKFEIFKGNVGHRLKYLGNEGFINEVLEKDLINEYWELKDCLASVYLISMVDYLCRIGNRPRIDGYDDIRKFKMDFTVYPYSFNFMTEDLIRNALKEAIPEFWEHNIIEGDVFNVC